MDKKKVLYVFHLPWSFIKQRPQFVAEGLADHYDVSVVYDHYFRGPRYKNGKISFVYIHILPLRKIRLIKWLNSVFYNIQMRRLVKKNDIIWFTSCEHFIKYSKFITSDKKVVFDCMDDILEFSILKDRVEELRKEEGLIYNRADIVFCSSGYLANVLKERYGNRDIVVVNNAIDKSILASDSVNQDKPEALVDFINDISPKIVYVGCVSDWMDNELLLKIINNIDSCNIYLFGPCDSDDLKMDNPRIHYCGSIEHRFVPEVLNTADILIMPFVVTKLILSVNPVKLYEYIASGKPSIAPLYGESEQFSDYVYLYKDREDCVNIIKSLLSGELAAKKPLEQCRQYVSSNTWKDRLDKMMHELEEFN